MLDYRFSRSAALLVGYRFLDVDYEQGSGEDLFKFDVQFSGPEIGVAFFF